ncbi:hypothetical protein [Thalassospira sp.]|uniref:hypothetical protein n=1 Tax=Thalassospira sp. TaxID=1912094 RepID=UPI000C5E1DE9|nr:hypothetical protein [Thalassospira sp.]MBC05720.1 hypothetical protein [Thalassospira sp.]|tara:strand:+ start:10510 stop:10944 length:435 start_codon:yes stop_codon:yes gene_type:complete
MATGKTETALQALFTVISAVSGPEIVRNAVEGDDIPSTGRVNQLDGNRGEPEAILSPLRYEFQHRVELIVMVQENDQAVRDAKLDNILQDIVAVVRANPTLSGAVDYAYEAPPETDDEAIAGAETIKAALLPIILEYTAPTAVG